MSAATYEALVAAGAPELPEGLFYRVSVVQRRESNGDVELLRLQIMREVPRRWGRPRLEELRVGFLGLGRSSDFPNAYNYQQVLPKVADKLRDLWAGYRSSLHADALIAGAAALARSLEGDHP